ncbi:hypothetical protein [Enterococcus sp. BWR-S5]|uniref:hypothetical protein n=1 Tax=Enterococcus sp. BWR-S5 TaxID=2787714 RepID=UPI00192307CC|nr:hypothetical protein [Enterococcus sp. BWR-S5]MBL1223856.1 hypothetical protein [Enterococcus sp. BWR-S5]
MDTQVNPILAQQLKDLLTVAYDEYYSKNADYLKLSEKISSEMGSFYMKEFANLTFRDTRVFPFELGNGSFIGYLLWSKELEVYGTDSSRFFILLTGFGFISGIEIFDKGEVKSTQWQDLIGAKTVNELLNSLKEINEKADFTAESPLIQKYVELLEERQ